MRVPSLRPAVLLLVACTAHGPQPQMLSPEDDAPAPRPAAQVELPASVEPAAEPPPADEPTPEDAKREHYERGKQDATRLIAGGSLSLEIFGYPGPCRDAYARALHADYDIGLVVVADCVVDAATLAHATGYNEVMEAEIARRHGEDALTKAARKAGCE